MMAEDMQELSGDELDKVSGGEKLQITTPIQAPPGAKERVGGRVRMEFLEWPCQSRGDEESVA